MGQHAKITIWVAVGLLVVFTLDRRGFRGKTIVAHLWMLIWPPLSAFEGSYRPRLARAWWTLRTVVTIGFGIAVAFSLLRSDVNYEGPNPITGR
jgi:hypothetical protein